MGSRRWSSDSICLLKDRSAFLIFSAITALRILRSALKHKASAEMAEMVIWGIPNWDAIMESCPVAIQWMRAVFQER